MEGCGDVMLVLSTIAAAVALWFRFSSDRAAKRALKLLRANAADREPGLTLEVLSATASMDDVEIRITNPAGSWNVASMLYLDIKGLTFPSDSRGNEALKAPFVIQANQTVAGHLFFNVGEKVRTAEGSIVLVDLDERVSRSRPSGR